MIRDIFAIFSEIKVDGFRILQADQRVQFEVRQGVKDKTTKDFFKLFFIY